MRQNNITFERARNILKAMLALAAILCILGLLLNSSSETAAFYCVIGALVSMALGMVVLFMGVRCPYCGRVIIKKCLVVKNCPHCRRDLVTGIKGKKR